MNCRQYFLGAKRRLQRLWAWIKPAQRLYFDGAHDDTNAIEHWAVGGRAIYPDGSKVGQTLHIKHCVVTATRIDIRGSSGLGIDIEGAVVRTPDSPPEWPTLQDMIDFSKMPAERAAAIDASRATWLFVQSDLTKSWAQRPMHWLSSHR